MRMKERESPLLFNVVVVCIIVIYDNTSVLLCE